MANIVKKEDILFTIQHLSSMEDALEIISESISRIYYIGHADGAEQEARFPGSVFHSDE